MGLYASASLIWGIIVDAYEDGWDDENDRAIPTPFYDPDKYEDDEGGWKDFDGPLVLRSFGRYENDCEQKAILSLKETKEYSSDCWDPKQISARDMDMLEQNQYKDAMSGALHAAGLENYLDEPCGWWLVASYG
jgi:hypothetical protein